MADESNAHRISISVGGRTVDAWTEYEFSVSLVEPADTFMLTRAYSLEVAMLCRLDADITIAIDGVPQVTGFIDERERDAAEGTLKITGRCKGGRLVQESIPTVSGYDGLQLTDAVAKLAAPWFTKVVLSDARNRAVRRGKGGRAPAAGEPAIFNVKGKMGKMDEDHAGRVEPGEMRWSMIEQLCTSVQLLCWSSADGRELIIGKPNYKQDVQYILKVSNSGSTVKNLITTESVRDRYAMIEAHGAGGGDEEDYGSATVSRLGTAFDGPNPDGTGRDFLHPKRLVLAQKALASNQEGARAAERDMKRRDFQRKIITASVALHGQRYRSDIITLFAPNTLARVIDEDAQIDITCLIYECKFRGSRRGGETTDIKLVPRGTEFIP